MMRELLADLRDHRVRDPVLADVDDRLEVVRQAAQVRALARTQ